MSYRSVGIGIEVYYRTYAFSYLGCENLSAQYLKINLLRQVFVNKFDNCKQMKYFNSTVVRYTMSL